MSPADARLALQRHATSKIAEIGDLQRIRSYGFRGEALPAIASVSQLRLRTRARGAPEGFELRVEAGQVRQAGAVGAPEGTRVEVADLFRAVPAQAQVPEDGVHRVGAHRRRAGALRAGAAGHPLRRAARGPPGAGLACRDQPARPRRGRAGRGGRGRPGPGRAPRGAGPDHRLRGAPRPPPPDARRCLLLRESPSGARPDAPARAGRGVSRLAAARALPRGGALRRAAARGGRRQRAPREVGGPLRRPAGAAPPGAPRCRRRDRDPALARAARGRAAGTSPAAGAKRAPRRRLALRRAGAFPWPGGARARDRGGRRTAALRRPAPARHAARDLPGGREQAGPAARRSARRARAGALRAAARGLAPAGDREPAAARPA